MEIVSPAFDERQYIPDKYTCEGEDINPPLFFIGVPKEAESLALIVDDPDSVTSQGGWTHWLIWNIKPSVEKIEENSLPNGAVQGKTDFGFNHWGGPCPPKGITHHYRFMLFALKDLIHLPEGADKMSLTEALNDLVLDQAELVGLYARKS
ncbi:YbhB/YbcL family Raf kinase inhibitor-like protein [Candidatus Microgenomates bacterium]|jgi:hypothetical protein|nr:MAG: YbhB/YbcL family Raf kinase inhibitor-like protein [Candidatus Microgenomates bacterium]